MIKIAQFSIGLIVLLAAVPATAGDLAVTINGVKAKGGRIVVALYDKEPLFGPSQHLSGEVAVTAAGTVKLVIPHVPAGDYVVSAYHDADGDGRIGMIGGKLSEGTALSNAEALRGAPTFAVNKVPVAATGATVTIQMTYPEDRTHW